MDVEFLLRKTKVSFSFFTTALATVAGYLSGDAYEPNPSRIELANRRAARDKSYVAIVGHATGSRSCARPQRLGNTPIFSTGCGLKGYYPYNKLSNKKNMSLVQ